MTSRDYSFQAPPAMAIAVGATTPNPGVVGATVWSTTANKILVWSGSAWTDPGGAGVALSVVTPSAVGTASSNGADTAAAKGDHVHAHGVQTDPTLHADATTTADGFMPAASMVRLAGVYQRAILPLTFSGLGQTYVFLLADAERHVTIASSGLPGSDHSLRVDQDFIAGWPASAVQLVVTVLSSSGNSVVITAGSGVTLNLAPGASLTINSNSTAIITRTGNSTWKVDNVRYTASGGGSSAHAGKVPLLDANGQVAQSFIPTTDTVPISQAFDAFRIPILNNLAKLDKGFLNATTVSAGAGDVGKVPLLNSSGKIDASCVSSGGSFADQVETVNAATTGLQVYAQNVAERRMLALAEPSSRPAHMVQPALFTSRIQRVHIDSGQNWTYDGLASIGASVGTDSSVLAAIPTTLADLIKGVSRRRVTSATTLGARAVVTANADSVHIQGAVPRLGGFFMSWRFGFSIAPPANSCWLVGATINGGYPATTIAAATGNFIGVGCDTTDTQLKVYQRYNVGIAPVVNATLSLTDFPPRAVAYYEFSLYNPAGTFDIGWCMKKLSGSPTIVASGTTTGANQMGSTSIQAFLYGYLGAAGTAIVIEYPSFYLERDF